METPEKPEYIRYDFHPLDQYIQWDKYHSTMHIRNTLLLARFSEARQYMEDIHKRVILELAEKYRYSGKLARTTHNQLAAVIKRYLPIISAQLLEWYPLIETHMEVTVTDPLTHEEHKEYQELCYRPVTREQHKGELEREWLASLQEALEQADAIEVRSKEIIDKHNAERHGGNVEFVKKIGRGGSEFTKRAS